MSLTRVVMPKLSEAMETGKVIKWLKREGDRVQGGDILAEVETDKADVEMEAFGAGVLRKILVPAGDEAPVGTLIAVIAEPSDDIAALVAGPRRGALRRPAFPRRALSQRLAFPRLALSQRPAVQRPVLGQRLAVQRPALHQRPQPRRARLQPSRLTRRRSPRQLPRMRSTPF